MERVEICGGRKMSREDGGREMRVEGQGGMEVG